MTTTQINDFGRWVNGLKAQLTRTFTAQDVEAFSRLTGDENPLHLQAGGRRSGRAIVQGAFLSSLAASLVGTRLPGPGTIYISQSFEYRLPVNVGETVTIQGLISARDEITRRLWIAIACLNEWDEVVMDGKMEVLLSRR